MLATLPSFGEDLLALRARPSRFYLHFFTVFPLHSVPLHLAALFMLVVVFDRRLSSAEAVRGDQFPHVFGLFDIRNNNGSLATWVEDNTIKTRTWTTWGLALPTSGRRALPARCGGPWTRERVGNGNSSKHGAAKNNRVWQTW